MTMTVLNWFSKCRRGVAAVELAVAMPLLLIVAVVTLDISLGILAKTQLQNAARAAGEYAVNNGYNVAGIQNAADLAVANSVFPITSANVSSTVGCFCTVSGTMVSNTDPAPQCVVTQCALAGFTTPIAFATITVTGSYSPLFPILWTALTSGSRSLSFKIIVRTSLPTT